MVFQDAWFANPTSSENQAVPTVTTDPWENQVPIPFNQEYIPWLAGAIDQLIQQGAYSGNLTPDELNQVQARWMTARSLALQAAQTGMRPFFQNDEEAGEPANTSGVPWYEPLADWTITAFLAVTFTPEAAIAYQVFIPKLRLAVQHNDAGAAFAVLINGVEMLTGESFSPVTRIVEYELDVAQFTLSHGIGAPPWDMTVKMLGAGGLQRAALARSVPPSLSVVLGDIRVPGGEAASGGQDCGDDCMGCCLRFENGVLQCLSCGVWTDIPGQPPGGLFSPGQPGDGTPQPPPGGGQQCYQASDVQAGTQWLVPTAVNTGDVLSLSGAQGAASDGQPPDLWFCLDGSQFFLGRCVNSQSFVGTDPLPAVPHMRLLYKIGSTYLDAMAGPVTVPPGVTNQQVSVVWNTSATDGVSGTESWQVCVTNNQAANWRQVFQFSVSPYGFQPSKWIIPTQTVGAWVAGQGFVSTQGDNQAGQNCQVAGCVVHFPASTINNVSVLLNSNLGTFDAEVGFFVQIQDDSGNIFTIPAASAVSGNGLNYQVNGPFTGITVLDFVVQVSEVNQPAPADGSAVITEVIISGAGTNPFA